MTDIAEGTFSGEAPPLNKEDLRALEKLKEAELWRLKNFGMEGYIPNPAQYKAHRCEAKTILYSGGNRAGKCVAKEFKMYDPVLGIEREVGDIDSDFHVLAYDGVGLRIAKANKPFKKELDEIYKVKLSNGGEFTCSLTHIVLTPYGFRTISDVQAGDELFLPQTILGSSQSIHGEDVQNSYQTVQDSQFDYRSLYRLCDERLRMGEDICQDVFPLQADVQEPLSSGNVSHRDVLGNKQVGIHPCQEVFPPSSSDVRIQSVGQSSDILSDVSCISEKSVDSNNQTPNKSVYVFDSPKSVSLTSQYPKLDVSCKTSTVRVISIAYVRIDYKWDFEVPIYHNYFANGCVHHNSTLGAIELCWALTKQYPSWFPEKRKLKGLVKAVVSGTEFPIIGRVIEPKIFSLLPKSYFRYKRTPQGYLNKIMCIDGSSVDILTLEMKDEAYESADWDFAWLDEPQSHIKYQAIRRGLVDRGGQVIFTFTPLTEPWMHEELISKADGKRIAVFQVNTRDNMYDINGNTILLEENIKEFEDALPEDVKETRLSGVFFHMKGRVYMEFGDAHCIDFKYEYPDPVICVLDPHDRQPHHVIWAYIDRNDDVFVDYEMTVHCELPELARKILRIEKERGYNMKKRIIDPNFGRKPASSGNQVSVMTELGKHGARFMDGDDDKETGHMLVREWLHFDLKRPVTAVNKPKLFFSNERAPKTVKSMRNLQFEDWQGKTKGDKNPKEVEKEKENHGADCVRYLMITKPTHDRLVRRQDELDEPMY